MAMIEIKGLSKKYGDKVIYDNFDLEIEDGKSTVILGESGTGKTTLLNVLLNQTEYSGTVTGMEEHPACIYQKDRLVVNLTVKENLLLCLGENADVSGMLERVGLKGCENTYPKQLSAGMSRRVAVLRAFYFDSKTVLMDEPFNSLDIKQKYNLIKMIKEINAEKRKTAVIVTHDIKEAVLLGDRIIVLKDGKVVFDEKNVNEKTEKQLFDLLIKI